VPAELFSGRPPGDCTPPTFPVTVTPVTAAAIQVTSSRNDIVEALEQKPTSMEVGESKDELSKDNSPIPSSGQGSPADPNLKI